MKYTACDWLRPFQLQKDELQQRRRQETTTTTTSTSQTILFTLLRQWLQNYFHRPCAMADAPSRAYNHHNAVLSLLARNSRAPVSLSYVQFQSPTKTHLSVLSNGQLADRRMSFSSTEISRQTIPPSPSNSPPRTSPSSRKS